MFLEVKELSQCPAGVFLDGAESQAFLQAFDQCTLQDFQLGYLQVYCDHQCISSMPYFVTTYKVATMVTNPLLRWLLKPLGLRVACVGHPCTDMGYIQGRVNEAVLSAVNAYLARKAKLVAYKMFPNPLPLEGFTQVSGLPVHQLDLSKFFSSMRANQRKNIRKRLLKSAQLRFEFAEQCEDLPRDLIDQIYGLYEQTRRRSPYDFAALPHQYFLATQALSQYQLAFEGLRLIGFIQLLKHGSQATAKYIGMDYRCHERYGLYFSLIVHAIESLHQQSCTHLNLGVSSGYFKRLLGCQAVPTLMYYRHTHRWINKLLGRLAFLLEPSAKELG